MMTKTTKGLKKYTTECVSWVFQRKKLSIGDITGDKCFNNLEIREMVQHVLKGKLEHYYEHSSVQKL
jgi:hypothetical protein